MIPGWKLSPQWRSYFDEQRKVKHANMVRRLKAESEHEMLKLQMAAVHDEAQTILEEVERKANQSHKPKH